MKKIVYLMSVLLFTLLAPAVFAEAVPASVQQAIEKILGANKPDLIRESTIPNIYEVRMKERLFYVDGQGRFMMAGNSLIDLVNMRNVTEASQRKYRRDTLSKIDDKTAVIFSPSKPKHKIYVFTDVECTYCRRFHADIDQLMAMDVEVRYLFAPFRGQQSHQKSIGVWCSRDRHEAMTRAKQGRDIVLKQCPNPIAKHLELVKKFGINGTPAIILEYGTFIGGFVPPQELLKLIKKDEIRANS